MTDDTDLIRENRKLIESKLDEIEDDAWTVVDFDPELDPYEPRTVQVTLLYEEPNPDPELPIGGTSEQQRESIRGIKDAIRTLDREHPDEPGAPIDAIRETVTSELDLDREALDAELEKMRTKGDVYSPDEEQYKVV